MSRIDDTFARCKAEKRAAFIPFIMGGDPTLEACAKLLDALPAAGADIIELGIPFSDPMADGPVIAEAGKRALDNGASLKKLLEIVRAFRASHQTPIVLMGYLNPIYIYGYDAFVKDAAAAGVDGVIIVDLPPEEAAELEPQLSKNGIALVSLIAPTSLATRLPLLAKHAHGYLYYVSIAGITGAAAASSSSVEASINAIRKATSLPVCVGFGIKTPADVEAVAPLAEGVVVGSAIVKLIKESTADIAKVSSYVRSLAEACRH